MNEPDLQYVFHGSHELFEVVSPKRQVRSKSNKLGEKKIIFDQISFHATPYRWIALAYTLDSKKAAEKRLAKAPAERGYMMGVSLYAYDETVEIYGYTSLEESLEKLYGGGGFLYVFNKKDFFHTTGLGDLEVVTQKNIKPVRVERIEDPVGELKNLGIKFNFVDLGRSENQHLFT